MSYLDEEFKGLRLDQVESLNKQRQESVSKPKTTPQLSLVPREYQYELFKKAVNENIIAVLDTGTGKTLISVMLIKHMKAIEDEKAQASPTYKRKITFFLVDRVPLVYQQGCVLEANCDGRIEKLCGENNVDMWSVEQWKSILDNMDIGVMTAQIFLNILQRGLISLEQVNLLVFDECHHAVKKHPFNSIMYDFYHSRLTPHNDSTTDYPKIFGMTASPVYSKKSDIHKSIMDLEINLDCKVYTAKDSLDLQNALKKVSEPVVYYTMDYIDDLPRQIPNTKEKLPIPLRYKRTMLTSLINSKIKDIYGFSDCLSVADYISNNLGPWCCDALWKEMLKGAHIHGLSTVRYGPSYTVSESDSALLKKAYDLCPPQKPNPDMRNTCLFTPKAKKLIECLIAINIQPDFCGIIFVERRHTAKAIQLLVESLDLFKDKIRCDILIGHGGVSRGDVCMKLNEQNSIIQKFRTGQLNLLITTNVAEEGLDIPSCNFVIRFDLFKTLPAYIQSRGRARRKDSKFIMMINSQNPKETKLLNDFQLQEEKMKELCKLLPKERNIVHYFDTGKELDFEFIKQTRLNEFLEGSYKIPSTGALLTLTSSVALIYQYCATLPSDKFCQFKPVYRFEQISLNENNPLYRCTLTLPINSEQTQFELHSRSINDVKNKISLDACIALHKSGAIDDYLVPLNRKIKANMIVKEKDGDGKQIGSRSRENLYPRTIPSFWTQKHNTSEEIKLLPYYIVFIEVTSTMDSTTNYRKLCLLTKNPLPPIKLSNEGHHIRICNPSKFYFEKEHQVEILADYMITVTRAVTNKEFTCSRNDIPYFVVPLNKNQVSFDWQEMKRSIANEKMAIPLDKNCQDKIVRDSISGKYYYTNHFEYNMTPNSLVPGHDYTFAQYYQEKKCITIKDLNQPLLLATRLIRRNQLEGENEETEEKKTCWLIPELCQMHSVSASVYISLELLPIITKYLDNILLALDAKKSLNLDMIDDFLMAEAYCTTSAGMNMNYQRLEFLGDSVLKLISSTHVFTQNVNSNESALTEFRMMMISNNALFKSAKKLGLYHYISSQTLPRRYWRPPHFKTDSDSENIIKTLQFHQLSDKTLADVIESTLGAAYSSHSSLSVALQAAKQLDVPLRDVCVWSDFNKTFKRPGSRYDATLREVNIQRVTEIVGYEFKDPSLLVEALTHASVLISSVPCYQRLEFLGDAVLDFCVTNYLFQKYNTAPPGQLHNLRKSSVNNDILSVLCVKLKLHVHIRHASDYLVSEMNHFVQLVNSTSKEIGEYWLDFYPPKVLSDVIESIMGAVYVDCGFELEPVARLFDRWLKPMLEKHISLQLIQEHPVGKLMSIVQNYGCTQCETRNITQLSGFQKSVVFIHQEAFTSGTGYNTREARKQAATRACELLTNDTFPKLCNCRRTPSY